ncbi:MAG: hypothetical protein A3H70_01175 [Candidatus Komeilibacteria bacterium RIFCSPLOWO2_02_FULL_48_11]|uniref:Uncharacterized protein n=1 Tax=Candidatus Komeilibacteria bacterium RIFCSPLOWO2_02_FULL_48_11 TaxID=1798553 RepID=A0A1G2BS64_9BACT|nr:MAG: hypothetical protein A3H70_01175 [Candidatus Komeilibacteria bacterium RIFCSPLOWO2_02_FULL_48_11]
MPAIHTTLAAGRWQELTLAEQLGNIGSEISRARSADERGNVERRNLSLERVLELVQLTIANESRQWRRLELQNLYGVLSAIRNNEAHSVSLSNIEEYCLPFALLARSQS